LLPACLSALVPTCHGGRDAASFVQRWFWLIGAGGWNLRSRAPVQGPWPTVLMPAFAASAWLPGLLGARAHSARVPAACGDGSELDRGPRRPRSASQGRVAPAHAWSLPWSNHLLSEAPSGKACAAALGRPRWLSGGCLGVGVAGRLVAAAPAGGPRGGSPTGWPAAGSDRSWPVHQPGRWARVELGRKGAMWVVNLIGEWVGRVAVARPSAGRAPAGGPVGWCSPGLWAAGW
jgi:hypothetical protein